MINCEAEVARMRLLTAKEVSVAMQIPLARVYELARQNLIPTVRVGQRQIRFNEEALSEWAERGGMFESQCEARSVKP